MSSIAKKMMQAAAGAGGVAPWDITSASLTSNKNVTSDGIANPSGLWVSPDGSKFYVLDDGAGNDIHEYDLSTDFLISTASFLQKKSVVASDPFYGSIASPADLYIREDGLKVFILNKSTSALLLPWTFATAWDVSTLTWDGTRAVLPNDIALGVHFKDDGTSFYVCFENGNLIRQYDMSTAWDITTASAGSTFDHSANVDQPSSIRFNSDGTQMFLLSSNELVYGYDLSSAWDISTASYTQVSPSGVFSGRDTSGQGLTFSGDGAYMYFIGETNDVIDQATL